MFDAVYTETLSDLITDTLLYNEVFTEEELKNKTRQQRIEAVVPYIFDSFPIFDEAYRIPLEKKILNHFYLREIGSETPELFIYYFNRELYEQFPYFNELYRSTLFQFNPLYTVDKTINHTGTKTGTNVRTDDLNESSTNSGQSNSTNTQSTESSVTSSGSNQSSSSGTNKSGFNDTPQGAISGMENALEPQGSGYLTNASIGKSEGSSSSSESSSSSTEGETSGSTNTTSSDTRSRTNTGTQSNSNTDTDNYIDRVTGYEGKPTELIREFRNNILNIDMEVIRSLDSCFMLLY